MDRSPVSLMGKLRLREAVLVARPPQFKFKALYTIQPYLFCEDQLANEMKK